MLLIFDLTMPSFARVLVQKNMFVRFFGGEDELSGVNNQVLNKKRAL
jgi:hypothetical protein